MTEALAVLLLEDSRFDAELLEENLRLVYPDAVLDVVSDEAGFVAALSARRYDVVLSDYELPGYDGGLAMAHARAVAPRMPFIFVSGVIGEDNAVELLKSGATDYVSKGRLERLPLVLQRALREVAQRDARDAAERALREARDEAERANRAKDRFLAVLSHELRTPLTPIGAAADLLEKSAAVPAEHRHLLPMIRRNVALEARLIDDLLDLTAIAAGKVSLKLATVDMHALVQVVVDMVADQIRERQLRLVLQLGATQHLVRADEARMQQVLWNILRNAVKFTAPGGAITLRSSSAVGQFVLSCADTGIGIDAGALARIFTAFEQADAEVSRQFGGLGLGLAIARGLVREHQGELGVMSEGRGQGATFTLMLEALGSGADMPPTGPAVSGGDAAVNGECRVLLVEDNPDSANALSLGLESYGYTVTLAGSCADALRKARAAQFDVVVTDLGLPDGSGLDIGRQLSPRTPVIALSGYGTPQDLERSTSAGFSGHIVKPAEFSTVHAMVQKVLARSGAAATEMPV